MTDRPIVDIPFEWEYYQDTDAVRAARAWDLLVGFFIVPAGAEYLRHCWAGNFLCRGTPLFHHPLLIPWREYVIAGLWDYQEWFMGEENQAAFDALPEQFTVYRGGDEGHSWSLLREVAETFGDVIERTVHKGDVFAFINDREEQEIVDLPLILCP